jgi:predicted RNase H-related nuclease YkuK (DUF458 family)
MDTAIARTQEVVDRVSRDKAMLHEYLRYEMALSDETSRLEDAVEDATKEAHLDDAKKALVNGISPELTSKITGLPLKTVKKIQMEMGLKK